MSTASPPAAAPAAARLKRVVALGASAGGLAALEEFFSGLPGKTGMAFLVATHMDPTQPAMLAQLLQRVTALPVSEAEQGQRLDPDHVYVIPPNKIMTVAADHLQLASPQQPRGLRLPIDALFESLAQAWGARAVAIVLTGMGADGTLGLQEVKQAGGLTLAQEPDSAQFDSMPSRAIKSGFVDLHATPKLLAEYLLQQPAESLKKTADSAETGAGLTRNLSGILALLKSTGRHDFTHYKRSTLSRRIERRMGLHKLASCEAYEKLLRERPQELDLLMNELLIGVTGFFRDRPVWQRLQNEVLPQLLAAQVNGYEFRAWVAGCSTGEEAYSLAIAFTEAQEAMPERAASSLRIFASDLSGDAIARARRGVYPSAISGEMTAQRLQRFFKPEQGQGQGQGQYRVVGSIREMLVFAKHDLNGDPPFTKLDLLSCRNLLIYFTAPLQNRLFPLFHYSLRQGGILLLGSSESIGRFGALFDPVDAQLRIYRRRENMGGRLVTEFPCRSNARKPPSSKEPLLTDEASRKPNSLQIAAEHLLLQEFAPPAVVVNAQGDILYINGRTGKYLEPAAGRANWNIHVMARDGLRSALDAGMRQALSEKRPVQLQGLFVQDEAARQAVDVDLRTLPSVDEAGHALLLVAFNAQPLPATDGAGPETKATAKPGAHGRRSAALIEAQLELQRSKQELRLLREDMKVTQEELQASNEELQSTNEELQSTNEELTSSKEELQSMNEELQAINVELQAKLDALELAQSDMKNLLNSTEIATLFLDKELNVRRFTEQAKKIFKLRDSDVGRPLGDLSSTLEFPDLQTDAKETLRSLVSSEKQVPTADQRWLSVRIMPYRNQNDQILGVVITFVDISSSKQLEAKLKAAQLAPELAASSASSGATAPAAPAAPATPVA
ncbi:chemotaxis protein CheB [Roseateles oligotrophus]|uniref:PAS domain-containing protein n=1 Tax=Roseateles oligotrophus TaxID=1769250 RepID=A0ABT2YMP7_9BURK|nr:chemotaxis protein CheB [Roseateles oligotrophus]MCV2371331.1 PAS domain-containing protein [Roseateles oligotrophus]